MCADCRAVCMLTLGQAKNAAEEDVSCGREREKERGRERESELERSVGIDRTIRTDRDYRTLRFGGKD
jgi:hypothetical protein